jgi:Prenyltransferase and squalene oxidase repeat
MAEDALRDRLVYELARRQLATGGWGTNPNSGSAALEPSCLATLAAGSRQEVALAAQEFLLRVQNPNGSWPAFDGDDHNGSWTTSLAIIALRDLVLGIPARVRALHWLLTSAGKESSWIWRWKFRTTDRHVRFDPDKYGWPWFPDTISWVVPTSFAILALSQIPCDCGDFGRAAGRVTRGVEMLIDRACPGGGWNAGNGVVYGAPLAPHWDDTAVALLALFDSKTHFAVDSAVQWLESTAPSIRTPWTLAWVVLALAAHGKSVECPLARLKSTSDLCEFEDTSTLAVASLALDYQKSLSAFGVGL